MTHMKNDQAIQALARDPFVSGTMPNDDQFVCALHHHGNDASVLMACYLKHT